MSLFDKYWDREPDRDAPAQREGQGNLAEALDRLQPEARGLAYQHELGPQIGRSITRHPKEERDVLVWDFLDGAVTFADGALTVTRKK